MRAKRQFSDDTLAALRQSKGLRIRAGTGQHRFIGIWVVVVRDRVFVRSWSVKPNGWYRRLSARFQFPACRRSTQNCLDGLQSAAQDYDSAHTWTLRLAANSARIKFNRR